MRTLYTYEKGTLKINHNFYQAL